MKKLILILSIFLSILNFSQDYKNFNINGLQRKAIIYKPSVNSEKPPVIFVFHGHGGNALNASKKMNFHHFYPEAVVVYMEGIPGTSGYVIDKKGLLNGWQMFPNENQNRDVNFFDEVLKDLKNNFKIDENRIYLVGHSNGARFVNVLWKERGEKLAAICSVSAQGGMMIQNAKSVSIWMSMGKLDPLVPYKSQKMAVPIVKNILNVSENSAFKNGDITTYNGKNNVELVLEERNAGHDFPHESIPSMVAFFKRHFRN